MRLTLTMMVFALVLALVPTPVYAGNGDVCEQCDQYNVCKCVKGCCFKPPDYIQEPGGEWDTSAASISPAWLAWLAELIESDNQGKETERSR